MKKLRNHVRTLNNLVLISVLVACCLFTGCSELGIGEVTSNTGELIGKEYIEAKEDTLVWKINNYKDPFLNEIFDFDKYEDFMKETDAAYVWEYGLNLNGYNATAYEFYSMSKEAFTQKLVEAERDDSYLLSGDSFTYDVDVLEAKIAYAIESLTQTNGEWKNRKINGKPLYSSFYRDREIDCFNGIAFPSKDAVEFFNSHGLKLEFNNVEVGTILTSDWYVEDAFYLTVVSADVTCKKNNKTFTESDWIPEPGETERHTFLFSFGEYNSAWNAHISIDNIRVIE